MLQLTRRQGRRSQAAMSFKLHASVYGECDASQPIHDHRYGSTRQHSYEMAAVDTLHVTFLASSLLQMI